MITPQILLDTLRIVSLARVEPIRLRKNGLPGKRVLDKLVTKLTISLDSPPKSFEEPTYLLFLYEMAYQLGLFIEKKNHLFVNTERCYDFFVQKNIHEQVTEQRKVWERMILWNEMQAAQHLSEKAENQPVLPVWTAKRLVETRKSMFQAVAEHDFQKASVEEIIHELLETHPNIFRFEGKDGNLYHQLLVFENKKKREATHPEDRNLIEAFFLRKLLTEVFVWLGLITYNPKTDTCEKNHAQFWQEATTTSSSEETSPSPEELPPLLVQPNLSILVFPHPQMMETLYHLEHFCYLLEGDQLLVYQIDEDSFLQAMKEGLSHDYVLQFLEKHSRVPLPENIRTLVQHWYEQSNKIVISEEGTLLEADTKEEFEQLLKSLPENLSYQQIDELKIFVSAGQALKLINWTPPTSFVELDYSNAPGRFFDVEKDLFIRLLSAHADYHSLHFLEQLSDEVERDGKLCRQLSQAKILATLEAGNTPSSILTFFEQRSRVFPSTEKLRLESFCNKSGSVYVGSPTLVMASSPEHMKRLLVEAGLKEYVVPIGPKVCLVQPEYTEEVSALLGKFGFPNCDNPALTLVETEESS